MGKHDRRPVTVQYITKQLDVAYNNFVYTFLTGCIFLRKTSSTKFCFLVLVGTAGEKKKQTRKRKEVAESRRGQISLGVQVNGKKKCRFYARLQTLLGANATK